MFRNHNGDIIRVISVFIGITINNTALLLALRTGLQKALTYGYKDLMIQTDLCILTCICRVVAIIQDIIDLMAEVGVERISFVYLELNSIANILATKGSTSWNRIVNLGTPSLTNVSISFLLQD